MISKKRTTTPQQHRAANPQNSVWVSANAGSGKTHVLVERVARLLLDGAEPSTILCITFTKAAAAEMSTRLFSRLSDWAIKPDDELALELEQLCAKKPDQDILENSRRLFARALETPGGLKIQTIHAFCEKLLQQFPVEAGMAPSFKVMDERDTEVQISRAISEVTALAASNRNQSLTTAFANTIGLLSSASFENVIRQYLSNAKGLRNLLAADVDASAYEIVLKEKLSISLEKSSADIAEQMTKIDPSEYKHHAQILSGIKIHSSHDTATFLKSIAEDPANLELYRTLFLTAELKPRASLLSVSTAKAYPNTAEFIKAEQYRIFSLLVEHDLLIRISATSDVYKLAKAVHHTIERNKKMFGQYDFDDLINRTTQLLTSSRAAQWVLYKLDAGLKHILVDEAQDTSPAQWIIIAALVDEFFAGQSGLQKHDRTLFVVGDRKQSIYSFQGADIHALAKARESLEGRIVAAGKELARVDLSVSYRTTEKVLAIVDTVFPPQQPGRFGFDPSDTTENPHQSNRLGIEGHFELWPLIEAEDQALEPQSWDAPLDREPSRSARRLLARKIAETLKSWIGKRELKPRERVVEAGDILILFQSRGPLFSMLISELRSLNIPVAGADRLKLHTSLIVQDLLMLLQWILLPQDDYALACVLKSPLVPEPLTEIQLMDLAIGRGTASLFSRLEMLSAANLVYLQVLQKQILTSGPYEFFAKILITSRQIIVERLGSEAIDASNAFLDQAMTYQMEHNYSLTGFLHWFESSDTSLKREMEQSAGEVRLMTVHGAKGLEANIVFLADAASIQDGGRGDPNLITSPTGHNVPIWAFGNLTESPILEDWKNHAKLKEQAERNRLLYVAMTRACDELYVCGTKGKNKLPAGCWYETISNALGETKSNSVEWPLPEIKKEPSKVLAHSALEFPSWALTHAPQEMNKSIYSLTGLVTKHQAVETTKNAKALKKGNAIHLLLQEVGELDPLNRKSYALNWSKRTGFSAKEALEIVEMLGSSDLAPFFGSNSLSEAEMRGKLPDGREVSARVDRLSITPDCIYVLDYKTDSFVPESIDSSHPYAVQLALYAALLINAFPNREIKAALLWTQSRKLMWLDKSLLNLPTGLTVRHLELEAP